MKTKSKTFLFIALVATALMGLSATAQAKSAGSCNDGYSYLVSKKYKKSVDKLSACLRANELNKEGRAIAYNYRAWAYFWLHKRSLDDGKKYTGPPDFFSKAWDDMEKSIELDPSGLPEVYCLRGWLIMDLSWGEAGGEDLKKGIAMGAPKNLCESAQ